MEQKKVENMEGKKLKSKMGPPIIRQTLTSYKRMLKANPLLKYQEAGIDLEDFLKKKKVDTSKSNSVTNPDSKISTTLDTKSTTSEFKPRESKPLMRTQSLKLPKSSVPNLGIKRPISQPIANNSKNNSAKPSNSSQISKKPGVKSKYMLTSEAKRQSIDIKAKVNSFPKGGLKLKQSNNNQHKLNVVSKVPSLRRSLSSGNIEPKKVRCTNAQLNQSQSEERLYIPVPSEFKDFSPIMEESQSAKNFVFKTPSAYDRRSICNFTPMSNRKFRASTPAPVQMDLLQERLNKWLKSRGKPPALFHNLRILGSNKLQEENKENIDNCQGKSNSYESLQIIRTPEKTAQENKNTKEIVKEAMSELLKLIEEDYPKDQCVNWLALIKDKYSDIDNEPEYWECRAAIEQSAGNVQTAVEFYKAAIIQGAQVNTVDKSLDQLLKKFSLLDISPSKAERNDQNHREKERICREARNVFKSNIIQFAIRERNIKNTKEEKLTTLSKQTDNKLLVATPVRRSTRLSRSGFTNTPGIKLCTSLKEIDLSSEEIKFETNKALC